MMFVYPGGELLENAMFTQQTEIIVRLQNIIASDQRI